MLWIWRSSFEMQMESLQTDDMGLERCGHPAIISIIGTTHWYITSSASISVIQGFFGKLKPPTLWKCNTALINHSVSRQSNNHNLPSWINTLDWFKKNTVVVLGIISCQKYDEEIDTTKVARLQEVAAPSQDIVWHISPHKTALTVLI